MRTVSIYVRAWLCFATLAIIIVGAACLAADAAPDAPKSPAAVQAMATHDGALKRAKEAYDAAVAAADRKYLSDLQAALKIASSNGATDEVVRIFSQIKAAQPNAANDAANEQALREQVLGCRRFVYALRGSGSKELELLRDGRLGNGVGGWEKSWSVQTKDGRAVLVLDGERGPATLVPVGGAFKGTFDHGASAEITLTPKR